MTRPIFEPSTPRKVGGLQWGEDQLYRRPPLGTGGCSEGPWQNVGDLSLFEGDWQDIDVTLIPTRFRTFCDETEIELACTGTAGTTIFTLPVGYRPTQAQPGIVGDGSSTGAQNILVNTDGTVNAL